MLTLITPFQQVWTLALLLMWAGLLFGGFVFGQVNADQSRRMPTWTRMASSLTLVAAAWSWWLFTREGDLGQFALFIAGGMTLGFVGDLFMARLILRNEHYVLGGIGAFGLGHILYIAGLLHLADGLNYNDPLLLWGALAVWLIIGALAWYIVVYRGAPQRTILHTAALPYALLLSGTAGLAAGLALQAWAFLPLAVGAALFLLSDLILAAQLFNNVHFRLISDVVWLTYGPGQMLIVFSVPLVGAVLKLL